MYKKIIEKFHNPDLAILFLRIAVGIVFMNAGWQKIQNMEGVIAFFASFGLASYLAYFVTYIEFIGGIFILLGVFSQYFAFILAIDMVVATIKVHFVNGFSNIGGYEYTLMLFFILFTLFFLGDGKYSLTKLFKRKIKPSTV